MKTFFLYVKDYFRRLSFKTLSCFLLFTTLLVWINYTIGIERRIRDLEPWWQSAAIFFLFYLVVIAASWAIQYCFGLRVSVLKLLPFWLMAPLYFAFKMIHWDLSILLPSSLPAYWDHYALIVLQMPAKLLLLFIMVWCWHRSDRPPGLTMKNFNARPYLIILAAMVPLIALASTRPDFLYTYPKVKNIAFLGEYTKPLWPWQLLYEMCYGLDFLNIELFFRGFLVIGVARYGGAEAGRAAILPMATFYCTIHFGKPLGECISSFFGGLILGVLSLRSGTILGGLMVHLGIAWLMEAGGWLGHLFRL